MHRIDGRNTVLDANGHRLFTDGPPGTQVTATWLTAVQEEICNVIQAAGISLNAGDTTQLLEAITALIPLASTPWWDVRTFGAGPNLGVDVSPYFQAAIDDLCLSKMGFGELICQPGTYLLDSALTIGGTAGAEDAAKCRNTKGFQWFGYNSRLISSISGDYVVHFFAGPTDDGFDPDYNYGSAYTTAVGVDKHSEICTTMMWVIANLEFTSTTSLETGCWRTNHEGMTHYATRTLEVNRMIEYGGSFDQVVIDASVGGDDYTVVT